MKVITKDQAVSEMDLIEEAFMKFSQGNTGYARFVLGEWLVREPDGTIWNARKVQDHYDFNLKRDMNGRWS